MCSIYLLWCINITSRVYLNSHSKETRVIRHATCSRFHESGVYLRAAVIYHPRNNIRTRLVDPSPIIIMIIIFSSV